MSNKTIYVLGAYKETSPRDVSFMHPKHMLIDRENENYVFSAYLPIFRTTDNSK